MHSNPQKLVLSPRFTPGHTSPINTTMALEKSINSFLATTPFKMLMGTTSPSQINKIEQESGKLLETKSPRVVGDVNMDQSEIAPLSLTRRSSSLADAQVKVKINNRTKQRTDGVVSSAEMPPIKKHTALLQQKDSEIQRLHSHIQSMQRKIKSDVSTVRISTLVQSEFQNAININEFDGMDPQMLKELLQQLTLRTQETYKLIHERSIKMLNLVDAMQETAETGVKDPSMTAFRELIDELASTLITSTKTEIDFAMKTRECDKKNLEVAQQKLAYERLQKQYKHLLAEHHEAKNHIQGLTIQIQNYERQLLTEKNTTQENQKKISTLEKRIELILETDIAVDKDKLRKAITELVKENDGFKRTIDVKTKEISAKNADIQKMQGKVNRLNKKVETLSKYKKDLGSGQLHREEQELDAHGTAVRKAAHMGDDTLNLLQGGIPATLDFRTGSLKLQYVDLLTDLFDKGTAEFVTHFNSVEDASERRQILSFIANQLTTSREFSDKLHYFFKECFDLSKLSDLKEVQVRLSKFFKPVFSAQQLNLWVPDGLTGIVYTTDANRQEIRGLATKGLVGEILRGRKAFNKRHMGNSYICELLTVEGKYKVNDTMMIPIKRQDGKIMAILEISNNIDSHFGFDEEYFAASLSQVLNNVLQKIHMSNVLLEGNKLKDLVMETFVKLTNCVSKFQFMNLVKTCATELLGVSNANFLFVERGKFVKYTGEAQFSEYDTDTGFSSHVYNNRKPRIMSDMSHCKDYNGLVDLFSLMPVYFMPVVMRETQEKSSERVVGILQFVIKPRGSKERIKVEELEEIEHNIGAEEAVENMCSVFAGLVGTSILHQKQFNVEH